MENKDKLEIKKIINPMLDFLFEYSEKMEIRIEDESNRILIYFLVEALDEKIRMNIMRTIKNDSQLSYLNSEKILEVAKLVSDIRMETTDDETKIMLIKNC